MKWGGCPHVTWGMHRWCWAVGEGSANRCHVQKQWLMLTRLVAEECCCSWKCCHVRCPANLLCPVALYVASCMYALLLFSLLANVWAGLPEGSKHHHGLMIRSDSCEDPAAALLLSSRRRFCTNQAALPAEARRWCVGRYLQHNRSGSSNRHFSQYVLPTHAVLVVLLLVIGAGD